ncbi:ABC transporter I family member 10, chloroplastic [Gossypium arboreum]|uniref:ABC transporter I family member 10, chloroplastic n=1 Tax=Gossypium arboreum TaxID=29729 RepID=A0A0B0P8R1_GOSAR|nr:ABC transporter I family member 10, chloroplastic [Gossypium arboreum]
MLRVSFKIKDDVVDFRHDTFLFPDQTSELNSLVSLTQESKPPLALLSIEFFLATHFLEQDNATESVATEGRNINFSVNTRQGKMLPILKDCSIRIPSVRLWMLLGPNGCGKSTILKACQYIGNNNEPIVFIWSVQLQWVTHHLEELEYADGAVYMEDGRVTMHGDTASISKFIKAKQSSHIERLNS